MPTIILTGGGSGGHIAPLLPLAHALKQKDPSCKIIYIGLKGDKLEGLQARYTAFDEVRAVPAGKFRRYHGKSVLAHLVDVKSWILNIRDFFRVIQGIFAAKALLKELKPDVVFSKGGYVAVPVGIAAHRLKIPIITHDSDAVPGLANRIIGRWAKVHAVGQSPENYSYAKDSIRFVGIPVDERIKPVTEIMRKSFKAEFNLPENSLVLLVSGGGLGSGRLNDLFVDASPRVLEKVENLHVLHVTGDQHLETVKEQYSHIAFAKARVQTIGFTDEFYKLSGAADLIMTRAGATTLAEFALQQKACLVIPAAQLTGGHQLENVKQLQKKQAAEVLDSEVSADGLTNTLIKLLSDEQLREQLAANLSKLAEPESATLLADIILKVTKPEVAA